MASPIAVCASSIRRRLGRERGIDRGSAHGQLDQRVVRGRGCGRSKATPSKFAQQRFGDPQLVGQTRRRSAHERCQSRLAQLDSAQLHTDPVHRRLPRLTSLGRHPDGGEEVVADGPLQFVHVGVVAVESTRVAAQGVAQPAGAQRLRPVLDHQVSGGLDDALAAQRRRTAHQVAAVSRAAISRTTPPCRGVRCTLRRSTAAWCCPAARRGTCARAACSSASTGRRTRGSTCSQLRLRVPSR